MSIHDKITLIRDAFDHIFEDLAHTLADVSETLADAQKARQLFEQFEDCLECKNVNGCARLLDSLQTTLARDFEDAQHAIDDLKHVEEDINEAITLVKKLKRLSDERKKAQKKGEESY